MSKELRALERIENFLKENCRHYKQDVSYIREALIKAQEQEQVINIIKEFFIIKFEEVNDKYGNVWARFVDIQAKEDEGTWDTTATADLVEHKEKFEILKRWLDVREDNNSL